MWRCVSINVKHSGSKERTDWIQSYRSASRINDTLLALLSHWDAEISAWGIPLIQELSWCCSCTRKTVATDVPNQLKIVCNNHAEPCCLEVLKTQVHACCRLNQWPLLQIRLNWFESVIFFHFTVAVHVSSSEQTNLRHIGTYITMKQCVLILLHHSRVGTELEQQATTEPSSLWAMRSWTCC